jgi:hypothetical protein
MIITATSNKALIMIGVCVVFSLITGASFITQHASGSNGGKVPCVHPSPGAYKSDNNDMTTKQNDDDNDYGTSYFGQQNYISQPFSALEPNWENIPCVHPSLGTQSYFGHQIFRNVPYGSPFPFRNVPYGSPFPFRNVPYGSPFPFRNVPYGLPFSNDYGTQPYFAQHKFRNDPFELPFP